MNFKCFWILTFALIAGPGAFAQGGIDFGGKPGAGGKGSRPTLQQDIFFNWEAQLERASILVSGEITKITKLKVLSETQQSGSRDGRQATWTEITTSYAVEFKPREVLRGKIKKKLLKAVLIHSTFDDVQARAQKPLGDYEVGNKGLLLLSIEKRQLKVHNFLKGNAYALSRARGDDPKTKYTDEQRLEWLEARVQFFDSLFRAKKIVNAIASVRKKSKGKKAFKLFEAENSKLTAAIERLRKQAFPDDYLALFENEQQSLNDQAKSERTRLKL